MQRFSSTRHGLVVVTIATLVAGAALAAQRSSSAANRFGDSLSTQVASKGLLKCRRSVDRR